MAAYRRVYDSRHLQADCQEPESTPEPDARQSSMSYLYLFLQEADWCDIIDEAPRALPFARDKGWAENRQIWRKKLGFGDGRTLKKPRFRRRFRIP